MLLDSRGRAVCASFLHAQLCSARSLIGGSRDHETRKVLQQASHGPDVLPTHAHLTRAVRAQQVRMTGGRCPSKACSGWPLQSKGKDAGDQGKSSGVAASVAMQSSAGAPVAGGPIGLFGVGLMGRTGCGILGVGPAVAQEKRGFGWG